jgi:hypothetical protein
MSQRALFIVALLAVVSLALTFIANDDNDAAPERQAFAPEIQSSLAEIDRIEIIGAGNTPVATMTRSAESWSVEEKDGYPADVAAIRTALLDLAEATTVETKTSDAAFYDRLGVEDIMVETATGVAIAISAGDSSLPTVILGDSVGTSYRYARRTDRPQSYLIDRDPEIPDNITEWLVTEIMDVRGTRMQQVTIEHADGERLSISKVEPGETNFAVAAVPEGRELQYPGVANVIGNALRELKLEDVAKPEDPAPEPVATIRFETFDGLVVLATAYMIDDAGWLAFEANFDTDQAVEFASDEVDEPLAEAQSGEDPRAEAEQISRRVMGWRYRIPSYQYDQITRRMEDLLEARS